MGVTWLLSVAVLTILAALDPASAQVPDHLRCYKVKAADVVKGLVDVLPAAPELAERDCKVKGPVLLCTPVVKTNVRVEPPAPGAPAGGAETEHLCYKLKCPDAAPVARTVSDQFGTFDLQPKASGLLCTPARAPTTTSSSVSTTTSTTSTTVCTPDCAGKVCGPDGCGGSCGTCVGRCCIEFCVCAGCECP